jgi:aryl sulfotransferase
MTETITWPRKTREFQTRLADSTIWNEFSYREGDIVIATWSKAGTTWMQQIVGQLLYQGNPDLDVARLSPWVDMRIPPKAEKLALLESQTHRRFVKTHLPVDALVFSPKARYIYVARDGRDVAWSMNNHQTNFAQIWRDYLNNLPGIDAPPLEPPPSDIQQYWHWWLERAGPSFWDHLRGWWAIRDLPNVRLVHFANLRRDLPGEMRRVAAFLEIPIDESRWEAILEYCSFDWMKSHAVKVVPLGGVLWDGGARTFLHKGENGRWKDTLTPEEVAEYEARAVRELGVGCAHWLATGEMRGHLETERGEV